MEIILIALAIGGAVVFCGAFLLVAAMAAKLAASQAALAASQAEMAASLTAITSVIPLRECVLPDVTRH